VLLPSSLGVDQHKELCAIRHDLLFREPGPSSASEAAISGEGDDDEEGDNGDECSEEGWVHLDRWTIY
jgi:hypothetical protein